MTRNLFFALSLFVLSACSGAYWPDAYTYPTGYTHHDSTPISSPHGHSKNIPEENTFKQGIKDNAEAWRNGLAITITPLTSAMEMNTPVAVVMDPGITPLNASAANYLRDLLVDMGFLTSLPDETAQILLLSAKRAETGPDQIIVSVTLRYNNMTIGQNEGTFTVPDQLVEAARLPGYTKTPVQGPVQKTKLWQTLNR